jgi:hypothetical protein
MLPTGGCGRLLPMSESSKVAERLLAHARLCQDAATLCWNETTSAELTQLAQECRQAALACEPDLIQDAPRLRKH